MFFCTFVPRIFSKMTMNRNYINKEQHFDTELVFNLSKKVVSRYVAKAIIPAREREDVEMAMIEKFLNQNEKIHAQFEGKSKISTYYIAILNRMCCEVIRKEQKHWYAVGNEDKVFPSKITATQTYDSEKNTIIKEELDRLTMVLMFFNNETAKIILFLKYYFDIPLLPEDIAGYCRKEHFKITHILAQRGKLSQGEVFGNLALVVKIAEGKTVGGDAVRMWLKKQMEIIINRMNGNGFSVHTPESISVLMEIQAQKNTQRMN